MDDRHLADMLLAARRGAGIATPPMLTSEGQAYAVQRLVMAELGPIGGWKVGAAGPDAPPACAPMPARFVVPAPHSFDAAGFTRREVESEICFRLAADLPARDAPYTEAELLAAIATCHPGIEVLQSRYADPDAASPWANLADLIQHGAYAWGAPIEAFETRSFAAMTVTQTIQGGPTRRATGNPAGDMMRLLLWLSNTGAVWAGGLRAGQIVTCGSWTGKTACPASSTVTAAFSGAEPVQIRFRQAGRSAG